MIASTASPLSRVHNSGDSAQTHDRESRSKASPEVGGFDESPGSFGALVRGRRVLIVGEVDASRATPPSASASRPDTLM